MSTTSAASESGAAPVQTDGVNFRGIVWFLVVIFVTTFVCQGLVTGIFKYFEYDVDQSDPGRAPLAASVSMPQIKDGRVLAGTPMPEPNLLADDPAPLAAFRADEESRLTTYGVTDKNAGTYRIPIERAKELLLKQGLPARTSK
jgi:hypothetical protein